MDFNWQFDEYAESFFSGRDYCFMGSGFLHVLVQLKNNLGATGNPVLLDLIPADEYRSRRYWLLAHHAFKGVPTCVAVRAGGRLWCADTRQLLDGTLRYRMSFERGIPELVITYPLRYELSTDRLQRILADQMEDVALAPGNLGLVDTAPAKTSKIPSLRVTERIWCPLGRRVVAREVSIENTGKAPAKDVEVWHLVAPNKIFLPDGVPAPDGIAACGYPGNGGPFLGILAEGRSRALVTTYPHAVDRILAEAAGGPAPGREDLRNPFWGLHLAAGVQLPAVGPRASATAVHLVGYGRTRTALLRELRSCSRRGVEAIRPADARHWSGLNEVRTGDENLDTLYLAARAGLRASVSRDLFPGRINSGIGQYDTEWSRDIDFMACAAVMTGQFDIARDVLGYALEHLMDDDGHCFCGGAWEGRDLAYQVDTNGIRLYALWLYGAMTGDTTLLEERWSRVRALIGLLLDPVRWRADAGMLASTRDTWERWESCGLFPGFELWHQHWASLGLEKAAELAHHVGERALAGRCRERGRRIWDSVLHHPRFAMVEGGHLVKRRLLDGRVQRTANGYRGARVGRLEPDASELGPILHDRVPGSLGRATLAGMEPLWNQDGLWSHGGYTRYHISSDPDASSGPWPGVTLMVARAALRLSEWKTAERALRWVVEVARPTFTLFEHMDYAASGRDNRRWYRGGIIPWLSYAEPALLFVSDLLGARPVAGGLEVRPNLPPKMKRLEGSVRYRDAVVGITVEHGRGAGVTASVNGTPSPVSGDGAVVLRPEGKRVTLEMTIGRAHR